MKKIGLSALVLLLAGASVFANGNVAIKKAKHAASRSVVKAKCTKTSCPNMGVCGAKK
ncbi:hypothetical protein BH09BAC6_BH09BAC6_03510 [soil metagenome]|jgi:hypothetical protein